MQDVRFRQASMAGKRMILTPVLLLLIGAGTAPAITIDDILVEGWYDTGVNRAVLVVDFVPGNGTADSFAFGVNFGAESTDTITGHELVEKASAGTPWIEELQTHALGVDGHVDSTYGWMLDEIWYIDPQTSQVYDIRSSYPAAWWSYWNSDDGGTTWSDSWVGASSRYLGDGDVDGWVAQVGEAFPGSPPETPTPEPSTIILIVTGLLATLAWRRWRRKG